MTNQSRRQFLKTGALFGAASAAAAVSAPAFSTEAPQKWDETTGLLIVGTGFAGCAAALEAHYLGAKKEEIMLVDKMSTPGGNSIINGGAVAAAGTDMQEKEGIKDSADLLFADIMKAGGHRRPVQGRNLPRRPLRQAFARRDEQLRLRLHSSDARQAQGIRH